MTEEKMIYCKDRAEWRAWLEKNHLKESKISLLKHKKHTGKPSLSHKESMEEAICFGWIDTTLKRLDEDRYVRRFARRGKNSKWSTNTLSYAKKLAKDGKMSPVGMQFYKEGLKKPTLDFGIAKNPATPQDLKDALAKDAVAAKNFALLAPSYRRVYLRWIEKAKRRETRMKRIAIVVQRSRENKRFGA